MAQVKKGDKLKKDLIQKLLILTQLEYSTQNNVFSQLEGRSGLIYKQWPKLYKNPEYKKWMRDPNEATTRFILVIDNVVVTHAAVFERKLQANGLKIAGLGGVVVKADQRGKNYGHFIVEAATNWIKANSDVRNIDIALLTCHPKYELFYKRHGWKKLANSEKIRYGDSIDTSQPRTDGEITMIIYLSTGAIEKRHVLEATSPYFGRSF